MIRVKTVFVLQHCQSVFRPFAAVLSSSPQLDVAMHYPQLYLHTYISISPDIFLITRGDVKNKYELNIYG